MKIELSDIKQGENNFSFVCEDALNIGITEEDGKVISPIFCNVKIIRADSNIFLDGYVNTKLQLECSRCLSNFEYEVNEKMVLYYKNVNKVKAILEREIELNEDDILTFTYDGDEIDLSERVRETILISLPMKPLCKEDCKGLCPYCGSDLNFNNCNCKANLCKLKK